MYVMHLTDYQWKMGRDGEKETVAAGYKAQNEEVQSRRIRTFRAESTEREHYLRRLYRLTIGTRRGMNLTLAVTGRQSTIGIRSDRIGACITILSRQNFSHLFVRNASKKSGQLLANCRLIV